MAFDTGLLTATPKSLRDIQECLRTDSAISSDLQARYSSKAGTFRYAGYDVGIQWDSGHGENATVTLTESAQRGRGWITRLKDWFFRDIPIFRRSFSLSCDQSGYLRACDRLYRESLQCLAGRPPARSDSAAEALISISALRALLADTDPNPGVSVADAEHLYIEACADALLAYKRAQRAQPAEKETEETGQPARESSSHPPA